MKYSYAYAVAAAIPAVLAEMHDVTVGDDKTLKFDPQVVTAAVGDQVRFTFYPNHDVAQGPFNMPCQPGEGDFYSGRITFNGGEESEQKFIYNVTSTDPIYYYCTTAMHCQGGMVGGINIPTSGDNTIEAYANAAKSAQQNVRPSANMTTGGTLTTESDDSSPSGTPSPSTMMTASGTGPAPSATTSPGAAANVQVGAPSVLALVAGVAAWLL